jgi:hypothetical protein
VFRQQLYQNIRLKRTVSLPLTALSFDSQSGPQNLTEVAKSPFTSHFGADLILMGIILAKPPALDTEMAGQITATYEELKVRYYNLCCHKFS